SGYSLGHDSSFHFVIGCPPNGCGGAILFQPFPAVPPLVATEPVSTLRKNRQRATCQPPRFPAPAARQLCDASLVGWAPMISAISRIVPASTPLTCSARSGV